MLGVEERSLATMTKLALFLAAEVRSLFVHMLFPRLAPALSYPVVALLCNPL